MEAALRKELDQNIIWKGCKWHPRITTDNYYAVRRMGNMHACDVCGTDRANYFCFLYEYYDPDGILIAVSFTAHRILGFQCFLCETCLQHISVNVLPCYEPFGKLEVFQEMLQPVPQLGEMLIRYECPLCL